MGDGSHALVIYNRDPSEETNLVLVFPLSHGMHSWNNKHPDHELEKQVEALIDWLRMVSLMDQLSVIDAEAIRDAIARTNCMVENRLKASRSIKYKRTENIIHGDVECQTNQAKIVSLAPELSLATIGSVIPVIEMPEGLECPDLKEMA